MKTVTVYEAVDGRRFDRQIDCKIHEAHLEAVAAVMDFLGKSPDCNGGEYVDHAQDRVDLFKSGMDSLIDGRHPRELDDGGHPAAKLFYRWQCIKGLREWGQPYYTSHPNPQAKSVRPSYA